jgi:hypothetical protein
MSALWRMQDFLGGNHPPSWDGRNTTYMWVRANNTARSVLNIRDASCGMWIRLPEGDFAGFSGEPLSHWSVQLEGAVPGTV